MKKYVKLLLGLALAALFLWLIFKRVSWAEIRAVFSQANELAIAAAVVAFYVGYACRIARWRLMLTRDNPVLSWSRCAGPLMASVAANNVLPFRAGDLMRALGFNRRLGISAATSVATLFVERLLDLLMVGLFLGMALVIFGTESLRILGVGGWVLVAGAGVILFMLLFPLSFRLPALWLVRLLSRAAPRLGARLTGELDKAFTALAHMSSGHTMMKLLGWSVLAWLAEGLVFWLAALALPAIAQPQAAWLALPVGTLATVIPSTPGYVGTFDFFTAQAMTVLGNAVAEATAYTLLVHALLWLPPTVAGGLYLLLRPLQSQDELHKAT